MEKLEDLCQFYAGFLGAYDNLIIEVGRRKDIARKMARIRTDAMAHIEKLYAEDVEEREIFRQSQGEFLPMDIWPGLLSAPNKWDFSIVEGGAPSIPDISASVIKRAIHRVGARPENSMVGVANH